MSVFLIADILFDVLLYSWVFSEKFAIFINKKIDWHMLLIKIFCFVSAWKCEACSIEATRIKLWEGLNWFFPLTSTN